VTDNLTIWKALQRHIPKMRWVPLSEILATVQIQIHLDEEDLDRVRSRSGTPRWESNVRHLLWMKRQTGSIRGRESQRPRS
jgi:hypothetical protein